MARGRQKVPGASDISIMTVWIYSREIYDAYKTVTRLPLPENKDPNFYKDEAIIIGDISGYVLLRFDQITNRHLTTPS